MFGRSDKGLSAEETIAWFEKEIARQQDIVYGTALFFECLNVLHEGQAAIIETHRKQFRNIVQKGNEMIQNASKVLGEARQDSGKVQLLRQFSFQPCQGHPKPVEMTKRAECLALTYHRIFPNRPRSQEFSREEILRLIEEASAETTTY